MSVVSVVPMSGAERQRKFQASKRELQSQLNDYTMKKARGLSDEGNTVSEYLQGITGSIEVDANGNYTPGSIDHVKIYLRGVEPSVLLEVKSHLDTQTLCITENSKIEIKQMKEDIAEKNPHPDLRATLNSYNNFNLFQLDERLRVIETESVVLKYHMRRLQDADKKNKIIRAKTLIDQMMDNEQDVNDAVEF